MTDNTVTAPAPTQAVEAGSILLVLDHEYGTDVTTHPTREDALAKVDQFVTDWWADEMGDEPMPADKAEARETYFSTVVGEFYAITDTTVVN